MKIEKWHRIVVKDVTWAQVVAAVTPETTWLPGFANCPPRLLESHRERILRAHGYGDDEQAEGLAEPFVLMATDPFPGTEREFEWSRRALRSPDLQDACLIPDGPEGEGHGGWYLLLEVDVAWLRWRSGSSGSTIEAAFEDGEWFLTLTVPRGNEAMRIDAAIRGVTYDESWEPYQGFYWETFRNGLGLTDEGMLRGSA